MSFLTDLKKKKQQSKYKEPIDIVQRPLLEWKHFWGFRDAKSVDPESQDEIWRIHQEFFQNIGKESTSYQGLVKFV